MILFSPGGFLSKNWLIYFHKELKERRRKIVGFYYVTVVRVCFYKIQISFRFYNSGYIYKSK